MQDLGYAVRMLLKKPGFTSIAVLALALGIGANTAIFSVVNAVLLRPLPYQQSDRLVMVWQRLTGATSYPQLPCSAPDYIDYRDQTQTLENTAAFYNENFLLTTRTGSERVSGAAVSANLFPLLGISSLRGRVFTTSEDQFGHDNVVVLSYGAWERRFGSDPSVLDKTLVLDQKPHQVIGVMPKEFEFPTQGLLRGPAPEFWVPIAFSPDRIGPEGRGDNFNISVIARRKPGVSLQQASADIARISGRIYESYPPAIQKLFSLDGFVTDLHQQVVGNVKTLLWVLLGAVGFVLLIGCANVANLLLAKAAGRRREVAIRTALGAGRLRLARQLLTESMLLGLLGGAAGLLIAYWLTQLMIQLSPGDVPRLAEAHLNLPVLAFTLAISILTGVLFGLAPALQVSKADLNTDLKEGSRGAAAFRRSRLRSLLVVAEVALSLVLLAGAGLLLRSFVKLRGVPLGFNPDHLLTMSVALPETKYQTKAQVQTFYNELIGRTQSLPNVKSAAAATGLPLMGLWDIVITPEGRADTHEKSLTTAFFAGVTPSFHRTLGISLVRGRLFSEADNPKSPPVAVINESMARRYWPNQEALGKRFLWGPPDSKRSWITVVGIVANLKQNNLAADIGPGVYLPIPQMPQDSSIQGFYLAVRTSADPTAIVANLRHIARSLDPEVPLLQVRSMQDVLSESVAPRRFNMLLLAAFAGLALLLASIGIYGVMSYSVSQYTHEIGIRMALGARAADVLQLIVRQGMALVLIGLAVGVAGALALTRVMSSLLFDVKPWDPLTLTSVSVLLAAVAFAASYIPARRATRVDPMIALRYE
ncbi:MAG TPA: ABC transporter permease [Bryobacteraceae bacterium]|jgi:putative ABC transport system permease protein|nr:ABC transporter permease [Bryobacteraceae bacterium]